MLCRATSVQADISPGRMTHVTSAAEVKWQTQSRAHKPSYASIPMCPNSSCPAEYPAEAKQGMIEHQIEHQ